MRFLIVRRLRIDFSMTVQPALSKLLILAQLVVFDQGGQTGWYNSACAIS
jgi:hypothetical protein